jgi:hypothetical protein
MFFGQAVEADMEAATRTSKRSKKVMSETERSNRRMVVLNSYLGITETRRFRDPAASRKA